MKSMKSFISIIVICLLITSCSSKPATSYTIEGSIAGLEDGAQVELIPGATHKDEKPISESVVTAGKFTFTGATEEPRLFYLHIKNSYGLIKVMVENGSIRITAKAEKRDTNGNISYTFEDLKVEGSPSNDLYLAKIAPRNMLDSLYNAYHENNKAISDAISAARMNNDKALRDSLNNTDAAKKLAADEKNFFNTVEVTMKKIVMDNKDSWWGPLLMLDVMSYFTPDQNSWYESFSQEAKDSYYGKIVKEELFPEGFVGKDVPPFALENADKSETTLAAVTQGKKYYLIDFWASWCAPCRKEIPNLKKLYKEYSSKGFEIVSISIDKKEADWKKALDEEKLTWPNFLDTKGASDAFKVKTIPAMFLVDEKGKIIAEKIRGEELENKLAELFK